MSTVSLKLMGGTKLKRDLSELSRKVGKSRQVRVGFLESATYANGERNSQLADAAKRARAQGLNRWASLFERWSKWGETHQQNLHVAQVAFWLEFGTSRIKPRPAFRNMISAKSPQWGERLGKCLQAVHMDSRKAFGQMGQVIQGQLQESLRSWPTDNRPMTVFIKQFNRPFVNRGTLVRDVDYEVH